jgi:hypothetical protein
MYGGSLLSRIAATSNSGDCAAQTAMQPTANNPQLNRCRIIPFLKAP